MTHVLVLLAISAHRVKQEAHLRSPQTLVCVLRTTRIQAQLGCAIATVLLSMELCTSSSVLALVLITHSRIIQQPQEECSRLLEASLKIQEDV